MKNVTMFYLKSCPYCRQAFQMVETLKQDNPQYRDIEIEAIEEQDEEARTAGYDYWYVPTYFIGKTKVWEGAPTLEAVEGVLKQVLMDEKSEI